MTVQVVKKREGKKMALTYYGHSVCIFMYALRTLSLFQSKKIAIVRICYFSNYRLLFFYLLSFQLKEFIGSEAFKH